MSDCDPYQNKLGCVACRLRRKDREKIEAQLKKQKDDNKPVPKPENAS